MIPDSFTYRAIIAILTLGLFSFYGVGCGDDDCEPIMDQPPDDQPPDDQPPVDQPPDDQPPVDEPGDTVFYSADIQPIFTANCAFVGCHGPNPPSGLNLTSYAELTKGGNGGPTFVAGDSANSLIIDRLEGRGGAMMPLGAAALRADQIQDVKDWIDEGGKDN